MITPEVARLLLTRLRTSRDGLWSLVFLAGTALAGLGTGFLPWLASMLSFGLPLAASRGWSGSSERAGLARLCHRHPGAVNRLTAAEVLIPALAGAIPGALAVLISGTAPWQVWFVLPLASITAVSAGYLLERRASGAGTVLLALYWSWSFLLLRGEPGLVSLLFVPGYPARVLAQGTGAPHPDGFLAISCVIAFGTAYQLFRENLKANP